MSNIGVIFPSGGERKDGFMSGKGVHDYELQLEVFLGKQYSWLGQEKRGNHCLLHHYIHRDSLHLQLQSAYITYIALHCSHIPRSVEKYTIF
mgnify:CR=1 FL=1